MMTANLPTYNTLLAYCRQRLPEERIPCLRNLMLLILSLLLLFKPMQKHILQLGKRNQFGLAAQLSPGQLYETLCLLKEIE